MNWFDCLTWIRFCKTFAFGFGAFPPMTLFIPIICGGIGRLPCPARFCNAFNGSAIPCASGCFLFFESENRNKNILSCTQNDKNRSLKLRHTFKMNNQFVDTHHVFFSWSRFCKNCRFHISNTSIGTDSRALKCSFTMKMYGV